MTGGPRVGSPGGDRTRGGVSFGLQGGAAVRTRRLIWTGGGAALAASAAVVALTAHGQDRPPAGPPPATAPAAQYYQGKVSPPPPGMFPTGSGVRPPAPAPGAPANFSPPVVPTTNVPPPVLPPPVLPPAGPKATPAPVAPRLTQPAVAGPDGVRQASAAEPTGTPPFFMAAPKAGDAPALPDPKPLPPAGVAPVPPPAVEVPAAATPVIVPPPPVTAGPTVTAEPTPTPTPKPTGPAVAPVVPTPKPAFTEPQPLPSGVTPASPGSLPLPSRQAPAVSVEAVAPESIGVGQALTYELVVKNGGPAAVGAVRVEEELPPHTTLVGSDPAAETTGDRLAWTLGPIDAGAEKRIRVTVKPTDEGELRSRATVSFATTVETRVRVTRPKITIALVGPDNARVGDRVPFQIKLTNSGTGPAGKLQLQAKFSDGLSHAQGQVIEAELKDLPAGQTKTLNLEVTAGKAGAQVCTVSAVADGTPADPARAPVTLVEPLLTVKQTGPARCLVKGEPTYTVELANPGTAATDALQVFAALPAGFEFAQATEGGAYIEANRSVGWRLPGLPVGGSKTVTFKLRAVAPADGVIRTVAQVATAEAAAVTPVEARTPAAPPAPARSLEARAETVVKAEGMPALRFDVVGLEGVVEAGKEAVYEIRAVNQGTGPCTNVQIVADLAEGTTPIGSTGPTAGKVAGQQVTFDPIPQLGVRGEATYRVRVKGNQPGDFRFRVRLACDQFKTPVSKEENTRFYKE